MSQRRFNKLGPIAATYEELQGIKQLESAFDNRMWSMDIGELSIRTVLQCLELLHMNCQELCERQLKHKLPKQIDNFHQHAAWHASLLQYALCITEYGLTIPSSSNSVACPMGEAFKDYMQAYAQTATHYCQHMDNNPQARGQIAKGMLSNLHASIAQNSKNIFLFLQMLSSRVKLLRLDPRYATNRQSALNIADLNIAFSNPRLTGDTYFSQFRVLHQVPELIARCAHERIRGPIAEAEATADLAMHLEHVRNQFRLITESTQTMLQLMIPSEYHQIRENLGVTSGSNSAMLRSILFKQDLEFLNAKVESHINRLSNSSEITLLTSLITQVRLQVFAWRDFHLGFPRNVLGGFGTRSLIGSKDAISVPLKWRNDEVSSGSLRTFATSAATFMTDADLSSEARRLDDMLLKTTSEETKRNFPQVQNRTGIFGDEGQGEEHK